MGVIRVNNESGGRRNWRSRLLCTGVLCAFLVASGWIALSASMVQPKSRACARLENHVGGFYENAGSEEHGHMEHVQGSVEVGLKERWRSLVAMPGCWELQENPCAAYVSHRGQFTTYACSAGRSCGCILCMIAGFMGRPWSYSHLRRVLCANRSCTADPLYCNVAMVPCCRSQTLVSCGIHGYKNLWSSNLLRHARRRRHQTKVWTKHSTLSRSSDREGLSQEWKLSRSPADQAATRSRRCRCRRGGCVVLVVSGGTGAERWPTSEGDGESATVRA